MDALMICLVLLYMSRVSPMFVKKSACSSGNAKQPAEMASCPVHKGCRCGCP